MSIDDPFAYAGPQSQAAGSVAVLVDHWREQAAIYDAANAAGGRRDEEVEAAMDEMIGLVNEIGETPSTSMKDLLAKAEVVRFEVLEALGDNGPDIAERITLSLLDDLKRIVGPNSREEEGQ